MNSLTVRVRPATDPELHAGEAVIVARDAKLIGREAIYRLERIDRNYSGRRRTIVEKRVTLAGEETIVPLAWSEVADAYSFVARHVRVELRSRVSVADDAPGGPTAESVEDRPLPPRVGALGDAEKRVFPPDRWRWLDSFAAMPPGTKLAVALATLAWAALFVANVVVLAHDSFVAPEAAWFPPDADDADDWGPAWSPAVGSLGILLALGIALAIALGRLSLRSYMTLRLRDESLAVRPGLVRPVGELISGSSRVELKDATLRIVAASYGRERERSAGDYKRLRVRGVTLSRSGWVLSTGVVLFEQTVPRIAAGTPLESVFSGDVDFSPVFTALYPPVDFDDAGVKTVWMARLISPSLVDQETAPAAVSAPAEDYVGDARIGFGPGRAARADEL